MTKQRIQVYAEPEMKRRIELAAAQEDIPVTEYCLNAIVQQLADDDILERSQVIIDVKPNAQDSLIDDLRDLHSRILARREGKLIDIDDIVELSFAANVMMNSSVCVDANLIIRTLVPGPLSEHALSVIERWRNEQIVILAPALLAFEVTSTLRRMVFFGEISDEEGDEAFQRFQQFQIRLSHRREIFALAWHLAKQFNQSRTYDAAYLAVAQLNDCEFWTADRRLFNAVGSELPWVRWLGSA